MLTKVAPYVLLLRHYRQRDSEAFACQMAYVIRAEYIWHVLKQSLRTIHFRNEYTGAITDCPDWTCFKVI